MTTDRSVDPWLLDATRDQRSDLHTAVVELEEALAGPLPHRTGQWATRVHEHLVDVAAAFERHIAMTEGPDGLFDAIRRAAPRLANAVARLGTDHTGIRQTIADVLVIVRDLVRNGDEEEAAAIRERAVELLARISRHRQRGADLVYEAYAVDIGVGD